MSKHQPAPEKATRATACRPSGRWLLWALCAAAMSAGCGDGDVRKPENSAGFTPAPLLARDALQAVLDDWKAGRAPGRIDRLTVPVQAVDKQRRPGQTLEDFEILGETPADAARCFAVRLKLNRPEADERVRYVVIGIDPLWVFRQEDFNSICQWECAPDEPGASDADITATGENQDLRESDISNDEVPRETGDRGRN